MRILFGSIILALISSTAHAEILLHCKDSFGLDSPGIKNFRIANDGSWASDGSGEKILRNKKQEEELVFGKGWLFLNVDKDFVGKTQSTQIIFKPEIFELTYQLNEAGNNKRDHLRHYICVPYANPFLPE